MQLIQRIRKMDQCDIGCGIQRELLILSVSPVSQEIKRGVVEKRTCSVLKLNDVPNAETISSSCDSRLSALSSSNFWSKDPRRPFLSERPLKACLLS